LAAASGPILEDIGQEISLGVYDRLISSSKASVRGVRSPPTSSNIIAEHKLFRDRGILHVKDIRKTTEA
jgi:hypothetical protein